MFSRNVLHFTANAILSSHITLQDYAAFETKCANLKANKKLPLKSKLLDIAEIKEVRRTESNSKAF